MKDADYAKRSLDSAYAQTVDARVDLQHALENVGAVEGLIILDLIKSAAGLENKISALVSARMADMSSDNQG